LLLRGLDGETRPRAKLALLAAVRAQLLITLATGSFSEMSHTTRRRTEAPSAAAAAAAETTDSSAAAAEASRSEEGRLSAAAAENVAFNQSHRDAAAI